MSLLQTAREKLYRSKRRIIKLFSGTKQAMAIQLPKFNPLSPPILVYQMGKVGSTTVYETLKNLPLQNPIYHIHFLSRGGIQFAEEAHQVGGMPLPEHIYVSKELHKRLSDSRKIQWKLISLVRDPIAINISSFFYNIERIPPLWFDRTQQLEINQAIRHLQSQFAAFDESTDYVASWFDKELNTVFGFDIYNYPFDKELGYSIVSTGMLSILILRVEDLDRCLSTALVNFLSIDFPIQMVTTRVGPDERYHESYKNVLHEIAIPKEICERIYSSKYAQHFYSNSERKALIDYWSDPQSRN